MRYTLFVLLSFALVALIFTAAGTVYFFNKQHTLTTQFQSLKLIAKDIAYHDEVLTMSTLVATLDDDPRWRERYIRYEVTLDELLVRAKATDPKIARFFEETAQANEQLIAMESQAFELVSDNKRREALALLKSDKYQQYKAAFSNGLTNAINEVLTNTQFKIDENQEKRGFYLIMSMVIAFFVVLVLWYFLIRYVRLTEKAIVDIAKLDELSGLLNRREFNRIVGYEINRAYRENKILMLVILDLDEFKKYNDKYGHPAGDNVIREVGELFLSFSRRTNEFAFRTGGEEFAIVSTCSSRQEGIKFCKSLCDEVRKLNIEHANNPPRYKVTASCGIAFSTQGEKPLSMNELYSRADQALYKAKHAGKNQCAVFDDAEPVDATQNTAQDSLQN